MRTFGRFLKFVAVGAANTAADFGTFFVLLHIASVRAPLVVSVVQAVSTGLAASLSYVLNSRWTWRGHVPRPVPFAIVTMTTILLSSKLMPLAMAVLEAWVPPGIALMVLSKLATAAVTAALNFAGYHFWAFPPPVRVRELPPRAEGARWTLVLPAYNEAARLPATLRQLDEARKSLLSDAEILFADDGSTDATFQLLAEACRSRPWMGVIRVSRHLGKGSALREAFSRARRGPVVYTDADLSFSLADVAAVRERLEAADVVTGARVAGQASRSGRRLMHVLFIRVLALLGMRATADPQCGLKGYRRAALDVLLPRCRMSGFAFDAEMLLAARLNRLSIAVHPVGEWTDRPGSRVHPLRDGWRTMVAVAVIALRRLSGAYGPRPASAVARAIVASAAVLLTVSGAWARLASGVQGAGAAAAVASAAEWAWTSAAAGFSAIASDAGFPVALLATVLTAVHPWSLSVLTAAPDAWTGLPALLTAWALTAVRPRYALAAAGFGAALLTSAGTFRFGLDGWRTQLEPLAFLPLLGWEPSLAGLAAVCVNEGSAVQAAAVPLFVSGAVLGLRRLRGVARWGSLLWCAAAALAAGSSLAWLLRFTLPVIVEGGAR